VKNGKTLLSCYTLSLLSNTQKLKSRRKYAA